MVFQVETDATYTQQSSRKTCLVGSIVMHEKIDVMGKSHALRVGFESHIAQLDHCDNKQ